MAESKTKRSRTHQTTDVAEPWRTELQSLSFNEAQTALELAMAKLQSSDLEVEEMAMLYRRAEAYGERCKSVLERVEQDVIEWDTPTA